MGQPSIPSLNKTGESMYWNSMWDDKNMFAISLNESIFVKDLVPRFFGGLSNNKIMSYLYKHNFYNRSNKFQIKYNLVVTKKFNYSELMVNLKKKKHKMFFSNVWFIKFHNWVFIYFFIYYPVLKQIRLAKKKIKKKRNKLTINIMQNYLSSLLNMKFKKNKRYNLHSKKYHF